MDLGAVERVLVPVDLTDLSLEALETARSTVADGARLHALFVLPELHPLDPAVSADLTPAVRIERATHTVAHRLGDQGFGDVALHVTIGEPAHEIVRLAEDLHAELIVMSSHHYTGLMHALVGSVAERVVRRASCAVLVLGPTG
ncbi:MAG: universal stress protein [Alphaproteobacteria bacterium]|nr:universal stress protein [Alphaproteobacteria bacterium]